MARRTIEETFRAVAPRYRRGIPEPPVIAVGYSNVGASGRAVGGTAEFSSALSQAGQQIAQLQRSYQQQATVIAANTQAIQGNTAAQSSHSGSVAGQVASSFLGGGLGLLSPVISGIAHLFGGGSSQPAALPIYTPSPPVSVTGSLTPVTAPVSNNSTQTTNSHVTVNISAMDSQSIMDRSTDIANAVREAMLNLHPINNVIANL